MDPITLFPIGTYQPSPFPAPLWLMELLLVVGFFLHAIPMNIALMGGITSAVFLFKGKNQPDSYEQRAGKQLAAALPIVTTAAITNGIVPLLFLQILYGPLVYTSSILMAVPWLSILFLLVIGYYGLYIFNYGQKKFGDKSPWFLLASSIVFMVIAFFFSNNMTLMLTPQKFLPLYQASPSGMHLNLDEPTLIPRFLHFALGAIAVTGLGIGSFGLYYKNRDAGYSNWLIKTGASLFLAITLLQTIVGPWFLFSLPANVQHQFLDLNNGIIGQTKLASHLLLTSFGLDAIALIAMGIAYVKGSTKAFTVGLISALLLVGGMVEIRHLVRVFSTQTIINPSNHPVEPQSAILGIFLVLFVALIGYLIWLGKQVYTAYQNK